MCCTLLQDEICKAFAFRPLRWRLFDLPLAEASREIYQALTGQFLPVDFPRFSVADAVSGRYVQVFFNRQKALTQL